MILEFNKFNLISSIEKSLVKILPYIKTTGNYLYGSTHKNKSGQPITRIDSKQPITGLMLKFNEDSLEIKSIVNTTKDRGSATKILQIILSELDKGSTIKISNDVSDGYWDNIIKKYPEYNWIFS